MFQVVYIPRFENEVVVGEYNNQQEATKHMERIKLSSMKAYKHHYIKQTGESI
jgi:hypothetical protein